MRQPVVRPAPPLAYPLAYTKGRPNTKRVLAMFRQAEDQSEIETVKYSPEELQESMKGDPPHYFGPQKRQMPTGEKGQQRRNPILEEYMALTGIDDPTQANVDAMDRLLDVDLESLAEGSLPHQLWMLAYRMHGHLTYGRPDVDGPTEFDPGAQSVAEQQVAEERARDERSRMETVV